MGSPVIKGRRSSDTAQMTLSFEPGLTERFHSLRECVATGIYQRGLTNVAPSLDKAPGNLSVELSDDPTRKFGIESLEAYIEKFGDLTPIYYLAERFLGRQEAAKDSAMAEIASVAAQLQRLMKQAGVA
jgi:hypothetical protein